MTSPFEVKTDWKQRTVRPHARLPTASSLMSLARTGPILIPRTPDCRVILPSVARLLPAKTPHSWSTYRTSPFSTSTARSANMKAILVKDGKGPAENLYLGEEETPLPQKGQVQVKVCSETYRSSCSELIWPDLRVQIKVSFVFRAQASVPSHIDFRSEPHGPAPARRQVPASTSCVKDHHGGRVRRDGQ